MSQIWCYLALSITLGLCCIIECDSITPKNRYATAANEDDPGNSTKNNPRQHESCTYDRYMTEPLDCFYSVLFGNRTEGDKLIWSKKYWKPLGWSFPLEVKVVFPVHHFVNDLTIGCVFVENSSMNKRIWDDDIQISEGGIGHKRVKMNIKSNDRYPPQYRVAIYGRKK